MDFKRYCHFLNNHLVQSCLYVLIFLCNLTRLKEEWPQVKRNQEEGPQGRRRCLPGGLDKILPMWRQSTGHAVWSDLHIYRTDMCVFKLLGPGTPRILLGLPVYFTLFNVFNEFQIMLI